MSGDTPKPDERPKKKPGPPTRRTPKQASRPGKATSGARKSQAELRKTGPRKKPGKAASGEREIQAEVRKTAPPTKPAKAPSGTRKIQDEVRKTGPRKKPGKAPSGTRKILAEVRKTAPPAKPAKAPSGTRKIQAEVRKTAPPTKPAKAPSGTRKIQAEVRKTAPLKKPGKAPSGTRKIQAEVRKTAPPTKPGKATSGQSSQAQVKAASEANDPERLKTARYRHESVDYATLHEQKAELAGRLTPTALGQVLTRLATCKGSAYLLASDGLSEKCFYFPFGGLRLTSVGPRRRPLKDAIRSHPDFKPELAEGLATAVVEQGFTLGEVLTGQLREIALAASREVALDELVDLLMWPGAEYEYRASNPPPMIFQRDAVKISTGVPELLGQLRERMKELRPIARQLGDPSKTELICGAQFQAEPGSVEAILLANIEGQAGRCTVDEAILLGRRNGLDAVAVAQRIVALMEQNVLVADLDPAEQTQFAVKKVQREIDSTVNALDDYINALVVRRRLAGQYEKVGETEKAVENLRLVGEELKKRKDLEGAVGVYKEIMSLEPEAFFAREQAASLYEDLKRGPDAVREWVALAKKYASSRLVNRAQERIRRAIRLQPENVDLRRYLIDFLETTGKTGAAVEETERLAELSEQQGRHEDAYACYRQMAAKEPSNAAIKAKLGAVRRKVQSSVARSKGVARKVVVGLALALPLYGGTYWLVQQGQASSALGAAHRTALDHAKAARFTEARSVLGGVQPDRAAAADHKLVLDRVRAWESVTARRAVLAAAEQEQAGNIAEAITLFKTVSSLRTTTAGQVAAARVAAHETATQEAVSLARRVATLRARHEEDAAFAAGRDLLRRYPRSAAARNLRLTLRLSPLPKDARVAVDGERVTSMSVTRLASQSFRLEASRSGFEKISRVVEMSEAESPLSVYLRRETRWTIKSGGPLRFAPVLGAKSVVLAGSDQRVVSFAPDGKSLWTHHLPPFARVTAAPSLVGDVVVLSLGSGEIRGLALGSGEMLWSFTRGARLVRGGAGGVVMLSGPQEIFAREPRSGRRLWRTRLATRLVESACAANAPRELAYAATEKGKLLVLSPDRKVSLVAVGKGISGTVAAEGGCLAIGLNDTLHFVREQRVVWTSRCPVPITGRPYCSKTRVYVPCGEALSVLSASDGKLLWKRSFKASVSSVSAGEGRIYASLSGGAVHALNDEGGTRWAFTTGGPVWAQPVFRGTTVYVASADHKLYAVADH